MPFDVRKGAGTAPDVRGTRAVHTPLGRPFPGRARGGGRAERARGARRLHRCECTHTLRVLRECVSAGGRARSSAGARARVCARARAYARARATAREKSAKANACAEERHRERERERGAPHLAGCAGWAGHGRQRQRARPPSSRRPQKRGLPTGTPWRGPAGRRGDAGCSRWPPPLQSQEP